MKLEIGGQIYMVNKHASAEFQRDWLEAERRADAVHEAAHTLVADRLGLECRSVQLGPPVTDFQIPLAQRKAPTPETILAVVISKQAGQVADLLINHESTEYALAASKDDRRDVREFLEPRCTRENAKVITKLCYDATRRIVESETESIISMARALLKSGRLDANRIRRLTHGCHFRLTLEKRRIEVSREVARVDGIRHKIESRAS